MRRGRAVVRLRAAGSRAGRAAGEAGSIAPAIAIMALFLFLLAGLIVDSARLLNARSRAVAYAEEAARVGAQEIDLNSESIRLAPRAQVDAAIAMYCAAAQLADPRLIDCGPVDPPGAPAEAVGVRTRFQIPAGMLGLVGISELRATGIGTSSPLQGVLGVDAYPGVPAPERKETDVPQPIPYGARDPSPSVDPGLPPTPGPSGGPTPGPSGGPTPGPSGGPTPGPSDEPTPGPSDEPTPGPTPGPTEGQADGASAGAEPTQAPEPTSAALEPRNSAGSAGAEDR